MTSDISRRFSRWSIIGIVFFFMIIVAITADYFYFRDRIYAGVILENIDLGKLTSNEALELLQEKLSAAEFAQNTVEFSYNSQTVSRTFCELGITANVEQIVFDAISAGREGLHLFRYAKRFQLSRQHQLVSPSFIINKTQFEENLSNIVSTIDRVAVNANFKLSEDRKTVAIENDLPGQKLNLAATRDALQRSLKSYYLPHKSSFVITPVAAEITATYLESLQIKEVIATYSTIVSNGIPNRVHNIQLSAVALDKVLILPNEEFSFNTIVGDSTAEKGYRTAPIIVNGKLVDGLGGGVCQVSSTLYNAVLLANLHILERRNHSLYVNYLPPGLDATVAYGSIDFRFKNTHPHALWLRTFMDGSKLTMTLYSTNIPGQEVRVYTTNVVTIPAGEKITETDKLPKGIRELVTSGKAGYKATVWRVSTLNGEETKERISQDSYQALPAEYLLGTAEIPVPQEEVELGSNQEEENETPVPSTRTFQYYTP